MGFELPPIQEEVIAKPPSSVLLHGVFGSRKTTTAATFSDMYPALPAQPPFDNLILEDIFYITWDKDAMLAFPKLVKPGGKIFIPSQDMSSVEPKFLYDSLGKLHDRVYERITKGKTRIVVHDTISSFDTKLSVACSMAFDKGAASNAESGNNEGLSSANQALFRAMLNTHDQEFTFWTSIPGVTNIFLAHSDVKGEIRASKKKDPQAWMQAKQKLDATGITEAQIAASITGKAWKHFHENCALVSFIEKSETNGKIESFLYPQGGKNSISRDRTGFLGIKEPADFRVIKPKWSAWNVKKAG